MSTRPATAKRTGARNLVEWVVILALALGAALALRTWIAQTFFIPSGSMIPTLQVGDRILVDKVSYDLHAVHRGDIVVFRRPPADVSDPNISDLVKRVVGLPGETIGSNQQGQVLINGRVLSEPWLPAGTPPGPPIRTQVIPAGQYFVMGDNRSDSEDSRFFGTIPKGLIVGRVVARIWPLSHLTLFG